MEIQSLVAKKYHGNEIQTDGWTKTTRERKANKLSYFSNSPPIEMGGNIVLVSKHKSNLSIYDKVMAMLSKFHNFKVKVISRLSQIIQHIILV
jgi:hypothetical protein